MNKANRDFAEDIKRMLLQILDALNYSYDRDTNLDLLFKDYENDLMHPCTPFARHRRFERLNAHGLFIIERKVNDTFLRLNPNFPDSEVKFATGSVLLPKKPQAKTQV
jgi:hypothetical protein